MIRLGRAGFSLIELVVVLAIMGLLAAALMPGMIRWGGADLKAAAGEIRAAMIGTRAAAIRTGQERVVDIDLDRRTVRPAGGRPVALPEDVEMTLYTALSEQVGERSGRIRFHPDGTSTGGHIDIARGGSTFRISVEWLTGRATIHGPT